MNLVNLEYFLTNKTQNMDLNALLSEKIETIFLLRLGTVYSTYIANKKTGMAVPHGQPRRNGFHTR